MSSVDPSAGQMADKLKVTVAVLLVFAGMAGFYYLSGSPTVVRLASVLGGLAAGIVVGSFSVPGRRFFGFAQASVVETRKVVWPTRKESFQTAGAVFAFVVVMAAFLWVSDKSLEYLLYDLILGWKK